MTASTAPLQNLKQSDLLELLIRHFGVHEGVYALSVDFQIAVGGIGPAPEQILPGVMVGVAGIGIVAVDVPGPNTQDAAKCNPPPRTSPRRRVKAPKD
jgi:hypothetical protein